MGISQDPSRYYPNYKYYELSREEPSEEQKKKEHRKEIKKWIFITLGIILFITAITIILPILLFFVICVIPFS